jgi:hypothetical protein
VTGAYRDFYCSRIEIGSVYSASAKFQERVGWTPRVNLREGLAPRAFYREHRARDVEDPT